jgi:Protein of unknown function (DUF3263)
MLVIGARSGQDRALMELTARDRGIIDFEREWCLVSGRKTSEIRVRFGMSTSSYYRALRRLLERPDALSYDPLTIKRLRRRREQARRERIEGRRADPSRR